ncbi:MAG: acetyltransferase [Candidatus Neomarinimicrobiota bacterium]|nr:MAG: acetyltransferase [Candidatus Neomarinimicrobiota bacterium]
MIHLQNYTDDFFSFLLESNNVNKPEVGSLDEEKLQLLIDQANYCKIVFYNNDPAGFLLCLPEKIDYDSMNYEWISERYSNFMYIDRISVMQKFQNKQLGTALYDDLIQCSKEENYDMILCEVNIYPPNPGSIRFHKRFDFIEWVRNLQRAEKSKSNFFLENYN